MLGVSSLPLDSHTDEAVVHKSSKWAWVTLAVFVPLLALVTWSLTKSSTSDTDTETGESEVAEVSESEDRPSTSSTARSSRSAVTTVPLRQADFEAPFSGQRTNLLLLAASTKGLVQIDLDTGAIVTYQSRLTPMFITGGHLVLRDRNSGSAFSSALTDLEEERSIPLESWGVVRSSADGFVWGYERNQGGPFESPLLEIEVATGKQKQSVELDVNPAYFGGVANPDLISPRAGGVYEKVGDNYRWVADGALMTHGGGLALIQRCSASLECGYHWLETESFQELELATPAVDALYIGPIAGNGTWLLVTNPLTNWSVELFNIRTGETISDLGMNNGDGSVAVSDDGRVAATFGSRNLIELIDLETNERTLIPGIRGMGYDNGLVLVPRSELDGAVSAEG